MADNFLEKRMDDYRRGALGGKSAVSSAVKCGIPEFRMPRKILVVAGPIEGAVALAVRRLCECGCKVAFVDDDRKRGAASAQATGALFYPAQGTVSADAIYECVEFAAERWGGLDCIIIPSETGEIAADAITGIANRFGRMRYMTTSDSATLTAALQGENYVTLSATEADESAIAALIAFMILPVADSISGSLTIR